MWKKSWFLLFPLLLGAAELPLEKEPCEEGMYLVPVSEKIIIRTAGSKFTVDPAEVIGVTFQARSVGKPKEFGKITAGFRQFAANGRRIYSVHVNCQPGTDAVLAAPLKKGEKQIKVKNAAWKADGKKTLVAVFDTKADHSDLPNFSSDTGANRIVKFSPAEEGCVTAELARPAAKAFPAGTPVRLHAWGAESEWQFSCWPGTGAVRKYSIKKEGSGWLPGAREAQLVLTLSCRKNFTGLKLKISPPEVKKTPASGDLW